MPLSDPLLGFDAPPLNVAPTPAQPSAKEKWAKAAPMLAMIPLILQKGGPQGLATFLAARQQAQEQKRQQALAESDRAAQQQRLTAQDQRLVQQDQWQQQYQQGLLDDRAADRENQVKDSFIKGLQSATDESQVQALVEMYSSAMPRESLEKIARQVASTERLTEKRVQAFLKGADEDMVQQWIEGRGTLQVDGKPVPFEQWSKYVPMATDAEGKPITPKKPADDLTKSSIAVQAAEALRRGDTAEYNRLLQVQREVGLADNTPRDPVMTDLNRQIAQMRLENMQGQQATTALPPRVQRQVDAQAKGFDSQPVTKRTQVMGEAVAFANSLNPNTKNPADDQALIYSFAKAMDPDSVVREGEYATVQKYAQSWAERFGFDVARIFSNTAFLTPQARANMKATIQSRYGAARTQYDNVRKQYADRINRITGGTDGESYLIDYGAALPTQGAAPATPSGGPDPKDPLGLRVPR